MEDTEMKETVITVTGATEDKTLCRRIRGDYYKIGDINIKDSGDCYKINDKYYKYDTGYIIYDHRVCQYIIKKQVDLVNGIIGFKDKDTPEFGYFTVHPEEHVKVRVDGIRYEIVDEKLLEDTSFLEDLTTCEYYHRSVLDAIRFINPGNPPRGFKRNLNYDSRGITEDASATYNRLYKPEYSKVVNQYGNFTKDYTFGLEFETSKGFIPTRITNKLGLIPLRDGSVQGLEYVTIPLKGKKGVQTIVDSTKELQKRTDYNEDCSLHLHIGGIPRTEEFFLALFKILCMTQDQMFALFPLYKKYNYGVKRKHYTKPLPVNDTIFLMDKVINKNNIKENFNVLYEFLSMGQSYSKAGNDLENVTHHPSDPNGNRKWEIRSRYYWVNLIPLLFGNKQTIEFRIHTPTFDTNKVVNYLGLCTAIIDYTIKYTDKILAKPQDFKGLTLSDILFDTIGHKNYDVANSIYNYLNNRKSYIFERTKRGDLVADERNCRSNSRINWNGTSYTKARKSLFGNLRYDYVGGIDPIVPEPVIIQEPENNIEVPVWGRNINIIDELLNNDEN